MTYEILWSLMSNFFFPISPFAPIMGLTQALHCSSAPSAALGQTRFPFFSHFLLGLATDLELRPAVTLPTAHRRAQPQGSRPEGRPAGPPHWFLLIEAALYRPLWEQQLANSQQDEGIVCSGGPLPQKIAPPQPSGCTRSPQLLLPLPYTPFTGNVTAPILAQTQNSTPQIQSATTVDLNTFASQCEGQKEGPHCKPRITDPSIIHACTLQMTPSGAGSPRWYLLVNCYVCSL